MALPGLWRRIPKKYMNRFQLRHATHELTVVDTLHGRIVRVYNLFRPVPGVHERAREDARRWNEKPYTAPNYNP